MKEWELPNIPNECISVEDAKFIFHQAEERLRGTIFIADYISTKSINIITILVGVISAALTYPISHWKGLYHMDSKQSIAVAAAMYAMLIGVFLIKNILPSKYHPIGTKPRDLCVPQLFANADKDIRLIDLYLVEIKSYNSRIEYNWKLNDLRYSRYRSALIALYSTPFILAIVFLCIESST